jgi:zinc protease
MFLVDRPGAQQSIVLAANIAPAKNQKNEIAIETMNEIIGGSFTSRVNMNLREDKGWAYGARTLILETKGPRLFIGYAPVQTNKTAESIIELKRELVEYLGENPASNEELEKIKDTPLDLNYLRTKLPPKFIADVVPPANTVPKLAPSGVRDKSSTTPS